MSPSTRQAVTSAFIVRNRWDTSSNSKIKKINLQKQGFSEAAWLEPEREGDQNESRDPSFHHLPSHNPSTK